MCWLFQGYHDATHSAVSYNSDVNKYISIIGSGLAFWDWTTWLKHHSVLHHSFTGDYNMDPDMRHTHPFFGKSISSKANKVKSPSLISFILFLITFLPLFLIISLRDSASSTLSWNWICSLSINSIFPELINLNNIYRGQGLGKNWSCRG